MIVDRAEKGIRAYRSLSKKVRMRIAKSQPALVHAMYGGIMADRVTRAVDDRPAIVSFCGSDLKGEVLSGYLRGWIANYGVLASWSAARRARGIVVKSRNLQNLLPQDVELSKFWIIPNGIDLNRFRPLDRDACRQRLGWSVDRFHILFPTNCGDPWKRPNLAGLPCRALAIQG